MGHFVLGAGGGAPLSKIVQHTPQISSSGKHGHKAIKHPQNTTVIAVVHRNLVEMGHFVLGAGGGWGSIVLCDIDNHVGHFHNYYTSLANRWNSGVVNPRSDLVVVLRLLWFPLYL